MLVVVTPAPKRNSRLLLFLISDFQLLFRESQVLV